MTRCQMPDWSGIILKSHYGLYNRSGSWLCDVNGGNREGRPVSRKEAGYSISIQGNLFKAQCERSTFLFSEFNRVLPTARKQNVHFAYGALQTVSRSAIIHLITSLNTANLTRYKRPQTMTHIQCKRTLRLCTTLNAYSVYLHASLHV